MFCECQETIVKFGPLWKPQTFLIFLCNMFSNSILRRSFVSFFISNLRVIINCFHVWKVFVLGDRIPFLKINQVCRVKSLFQYWHSFASLVCHRFQYALIIFISDICDSIRIFFSLKGKFYVNFTRKADIGFSRKINSSDV